MSNEKWFDEISPQGVLCKCNDSIIAVIVDYIPSPDGMPFVSVGQRFSKAEPLTAQDWWDFAPWQSIETAPIDTPIIIMVKGVVQDAIYAVNEKNEAYLWFNGEVMAYTTEIDKWLPLPKVNHE